MFINKQLDYRHFIWRGQRDSSWLLEPTLDRAMREADNLGNTSIIETHLNRFKYASRGRRGPNPPPITSENDWWALGQHQGLQTPLLDWTRSPFIASFFAYISPKSSPTEYRAVFGISQVTIERISSNIAATHKSKTRPPIIEFIEPLSDENTRCVNQNALFTRAPSGTDIETWFINNFPEKGNKVRMWKILLPENDRIISLRSLNRMNINYLSLFPDLFGSSSFVNTDLNIDKY